jgi:protoheme IX farnesyltransferase
MKLVRRLATTTAAATMALVAVGGIVRATGSGDACPDWPQCFGRWVPPLEARPIIEYTHRLLGVIVGILILLTAWFAWRRKRGDGLVVWPALLAVPLVLVQGAIGAGRIFVGPNAWIVTIHLLVAMAVVAAVMVAATAAAVPERRGEGEHPSIAARAWPALWATAAVLLIGAYVRGANASLVFLDWPLMDGTIVPRLTTEAAIVTFVHRALAAVTVVLGGMLAFRARRSPHRVIRVLAWSAFGLLLLQAGIGGAVVLSRLTPAAVAGHVAGGSLAWAALVALVAADGRIRGRAEDGARPSARHVAGAYAQLMKPDIIVLLLITTVPTMILAAGGLPPAGLIAATLIGGTLAAGGANALNHYFDRDIDEVMDRTRARPIPAHRVSPEQAARFGVGLSVLSFVWLATTVNPASAGLALSAILFYVGVYTLWMKRSTPQNIVIGGAAGAVPVLVGWAAVTGTVALPAWVLFAVVFFWTPPHFWALSMKYRADYAAAGVPMLVVVRGGEETARHILLYAIQTVAVSLLLFPLARMGPVYLAAAGGLGAVFVAYALQVVRDGTPRAAMHLFHFSITYLGLLFAAVAVDTLARAAS